MLKVSVDFAGQAAKEADNCTAQVFIQAYRNMLIKDQLNFNDEEHFKYMDKKSLSMGCGCELCRLRHKYTMAKLERHRAYKRATTDEYIYHANGVGCASEDFDRVDELDQEMALLFYQKALVKERLGYDKSKSRTKVPESTPVYRGKDKNICASGLLKPKTHRPHTFSQSAA